MKIIKIEKEKSIHGGYTRHGIGYTEHDGYHGTSDNRMPIKAAIGQEYAMCIRDGEEFMIEVNGSLLKGGAIFKKLLGFSQDLELLNY